MPIRPTLLALLVACLAACTAPDRASTSDASRVADAEPPRIVTDYTAPEPRLVIDAGATPLAIHAARVLDPATGVMREDAHVVIDGESIVGVTGSVPPAGVPVAELGDVTLMPGFIDCHTHLCSDLTEGWEHRGVTEAPADAALRGAHNAGLTLRAGFTTVRDVGSGGFADVALRKAIEAGRIQGPRMLSAGHSLSITGGHGDETGYRPGVAERGPEQGIADGVDECVAAVRHQVKHGATVIKVVATAGVLSHEGPVGAQQYSQEELDAVVAEAARHGLKVAAHAHGNAGIKAAVRAGVASIEHGSVLDDEAMELMKSRGCYLVPTTYLADAIDLDQLPPMIRAKAESILPVARDSVSRAIAAGVPIAYGTDAGVYPHGLNAREFAVLVARGMTPLEAIQSATVNAADLLGLDDRGALAPGMLADLVAVPGDVLEDITATERPAFVIRGGDFVLGSP